MSLRYEKNVDLIKKIEYKDKAKRSETFRVIRSKGMMILFTIFAFIALGILFWILGVLLVNGLESIKITTFLNDTAPHTDPTGGLRNAIVGQLILSLGASMVGVPLGILAGTYLSEYGGNSRFSNFIRDMSDILMSAPSIIIATFVYAFMVVPMGKFSGWAGIVALSIMMFPIVLRTTDDMLSLVPKTLREAAYALGAPKYRVILNVVYRGAKVGLFTGVLLALSRIIGEAAPLLFTSLNNSSFTVNLNDQFPSLTVTMFNYATSPFKEWQSLGWGAAFILAAFVLTVNIIGKYIINREKGKM